MCFLLLHGYSHAFMIPKPKDKRNSVCDPNNYMAIALSRMFSNNL